MSTRTFQRHRQPGHFNEAIVSPKPSVAERLNEHSTLRWAVQRKIPKRIARGGASESLTWRVRKLLSSQQLRDAQLRKAPCFLRWWHRSEGTHTVCRFIESFGSRLYSRKV